MTIPQAIETAQNHLKAGRTPAAAKLAKEILAHEPQNPVAIGILALAAGSEDRYEESASLMQKSIDCSPIPSAEQYFCLGEAQRHLMRIDLAANALQKAVDLDPHHPDAHFGLAMARLCQGDLASGFEQFEWRWRSSKSPLPRPKFDVPTWDGSDPAGKTILVWAEQGFGDVIQCARYVPLLAKRGARVIVGVQEPLHQLMKSLDGASNVVSRYEEAGAFDLELPFFSLPHRFGTTLQTIPADVPYLHADESTSREWKNRLADDPSPLKVGLVWAGTSTHGSDRQRSLPTSALAVLKGIEGVSFYNLQVGERAKETIPLSLKNLSPLLADFSQTAAALTNLDLLITVDTAIAHVAGAIGRPVWTILGFFSDWRWMIDRSDTPWYPTMKLFRQKHVGDWIPPLKQVAESLRQLAHQSRTTNV